MYTPIFFREFTFIFAAGAGKLGGAAGTLMGLMGCVGEMSLRNFDGSNAGVMGEPTPCPLLATISGKFYLFWW
jgi:hypothetical protein